MNLVSNTFPPCPIAVRRPLLDKTSRDIGVGRSYQNADLNITLDGSDCLKQTIPLHEENQLPV